MNVVFVELDRCIACLSCVQACQFQKAEKNSGWSPNIFVHVDIDQRRIYTGTCPQCETAICMEVCPVDALTRDIETGAILVEKEVCLGCGTCVAACPFGYIKLEELFPKATKCDLCGGDPICVKMCMAKALHFGDINSFAESKNKKPELRLGLRAVPDDEGNGQ